MKTAKTLYSSLYRNFKAHGIPNPRNSTVQILEKALGKPRENIKGLFPSALSLYHINQINKMAQRRMKHEPLQYIIKEKEFNGLNIELEKSLWIPGHSAQMLVKTALELLPDLKNNYHILEVGCGCGAISLSMLNDRPQSQVVALDQSLLALELTGKNYFKVFGRTDDQFEKKMKLIQGDYSVFTKTNLQKFDIIISNPPILPTEEWELLGKETKLYTNRKAIDGGKYGLDAIWKLIRKSGENMKMGGHLVFTAKPDQAMFLDEYFRNHADEVHNLKIDSMKFDLNGKTVIMVMKKTGQKKVDSETTESEKEL